MQRTSVLENFTQLHVAGVRFDPVNLKWIDRENKVISISINGKRFSEESIWNVFCEKIRVVWDKCFEVIDRLMCCGNSIRYSWTEAPIIRLYRRVYKAFNIHTAYLATMMIYQNRFNLIGVRANQDRDPLDELNNQYNAFLSIKGAAKTILSDPRFNINDMLEDPDYDLASIEPYLAVLRNPHVQREIQVP